MSPARDLSVEQTPETIAAAVETFLFEHTGAVVLEEGRVIFELRTARYSLTAEHGRCTLHLRSEERNLVRRVSGTALRDGVLRLSTQRFGQTRAQTLEIAADRDRRTPSTREAMRQRYVKTLERMLARSFPAWRAEGFRTAMDLEKSFGPAYARGVLVRGTYAWAV